MLQLCALRACFPQLGTGGASSCHVEQSGIVMEGLPIVKARTSGCKHGAAGMPPTCLPLCLALEAVSYPTVTVLTVILQNRFYKLLCLWILIR